MSRKEINARVREIIDARREQKKVLEDGVIKPIKDVIKLGQLVIMQQKSVEEFIYQNKKLGEHLQGLLKTEKVK